MKQPTFLDIIMQSLIQFNGSPEFRREEVTKAHQPSKDKDFCFMEMSCYF